MTKRLKIMVMMAIMVAIVLLSGCVAVPQSQAQRDIGTLIKRPTAVVLDREYGNKPIHYVTAIKSYFSVKLPRAKDARYKFSDPKRAYKRKGFAYGGDVDWKGWLVETSISIPNRSGRLLTPKPYMVLFSGNQIVEHILGNSHKLLVKVDR